MSADKQDLNGVDRVGSLRQLGKAVAPSLSLLYLTSKSSLIRDIENAGLSQQSLS